jgi:hypothetical protein
MAKGASRPAGPGLSALPLLTLLAAETLPSNDESLRSRGYGRRRRGAGDRLVVHRMRDERGSIAS